MQEILSNSVTETINIAKNIAKCLEKKDVIVLSGDLGSGKTHFVKGIVSYFLSDDTVCSPTFTIVNEYSSIPPIYHFDVYRLNDFNEFIALGGEEYFEKGISIIEWGEKILNILPKNYLHITITQLSPTSRKFSFSSTNEKFNTYIKEAFDENISN